MGKEDWNVGLELQELLFTEHGFEQGHSGGLFLRRMDAQHGVVIKASRWTAAGGGDRKLGVLIGFARRDNNLLWRDLINERVNEWRTTVDVLDPVGTGYKNFIGTDGLRPDIAGWLNKTVPRLVELANYRYISDTLAEQGVAYEGRLDPTRFPRMMEALLGGWNDAHEEEFLAPMVAQLDETWKSDPDGSERRGKIDRVRAWIEQHPDGVERELLG